MSLLVCVMCFFLLLGYNESLRFANHYSHHMVLQREPYRAVLWGFGESGTDVSISVIDVASKHRTSYSCKVESDSRGLSIWRVILKPYKAGGPYEISLNGDNGTNTFSTSLSDIYFGDVWICSGQSNMGFTASMAMSRHKEINLAPKYKQVRLFTVRPYYSNVIVPELSAHNILQQWSVASKHSVGGPTWQYFSAVCWMFGRRLYDHLQVPIGLIVTSDGGTRIESWSSPETLKQCNISKSHKGAPPTDDPRNNLSAMYNAMIYPLLNVTLYGIIWYQGEQNTIKRNDPYDCTFPALINGWRKEWFHASQKNTNLEFPFGFVQLGTLSLYYQHLLPYYAPIRWKQTTNYGFVPNPEQTNTFMAVAMDLPDNESPYDSFHPRYKADVAERLLLGALDLGYHKDTYWTGPIVDEVRVNEPDSVFVIVNVIYKSSSLTEGGIEVRSRVGFQVEFDSNGTWVLVTVSAFGFDFIELLIRKENNNIVTGVRYAWSAEPCRFKECPIYDKNSGLPSPPFIKFAPFDEYLVH